MRNKKNFDTKNQNIFFTSDLHLGHGNIIKYSRRDLFLCDRDKNSLNRLKNNWTLDPHYRVSSESVQNMNDALINNINKIVKKDDILFHLGDFLFSKNSYREDAKKYRDRINCKNIYQIWGNHDYEEIYPLFSFDENLMEISVDFQKIVLCHYSMLVWNKCHRGSWHLYGHSHSSIEDFAEKTLPERKSMDVGVDNAYKILGEYRPFYFEEIKNLLNNKKGHNTHDHHSN